MELAVAVIPLGQSRRRHTDPPNSYRTLRRYKISITGFTLISSMSFMSLGLIAADNTTKPLNRAFDTPAEVDPIRHVLGTALAWGGNPYKDAAYLNGIASTRTLAKLANHVAKHYMERTKGVVNLGDPKILQWVLRNSPVGDVWGVGRKLRIQLEEMGIHTALDLLKADPRLLKKKFSVVLEKTARELSGVSCLESLEADPSKNEICSSRSFGERLTDVGLIKAAVAAYLQRAATKLAG
jgi:hypothetical protein